MEPHPSRPWGLDWRSAPSFVIATVGIGLFTDLFLYGLVVPVLPFLLQDRLDIPEDQIQSYSSGLLAAYAGASVAFSLPAGWIADRLNSRQVPFLGGLTLLLAATALMAFGQSITVLVVARVLSGMSAAVVWAAGLAMVQDTVERGRMGQVTGAIFSIASVAELVGPVSGGVLYEKAGIEAVFGVAAAALVVDLAMRLLVIEKQTAAIYISESGGDEDSEQNESTQRERQEADTEEAREGDALLPKDPERYKIDQEVVGPVIKAFPILYCFREPRFLVSLYLSFAQPLLVGVFDATVPTEAKELLHFTSLEVGMLFMALVIPYLALGQVAGMAVDRYGTKVVATAGYCYLVPCLVLLGLPSQDFIPPDAKVTLFGVILALQGIGFSVVGAPALVEATDIMHEYDEANPGFFGANGPYAQLYGFSSLFLFSGLAIGPLVGGLLRAQFGYGVMAVGLSLFCAVTAILSFMLVGAERQ